MFGSINSNSKVPQDKHEFGRSILEIMTGFKNRGSVLLISKREVGQVLLLIFVIAYLL